MCNALDQGAYKVRFERKQCGLFRFCLIFLSFCIVASCLISKIHNSTGSEAYRCHPTSEIRYSTSDIPDLTSDIWYPRFDIRHPRFDIPDLASDIWYPRCDIRHPTSEIRRPTPDIRHPRFDIRHPRCHIRHLKGWPWCVVPGIKGPTKWGLKGNNSDYSGFA